MQGSVFPNYWTPLCFSILKGYTVCAKITEPDKFVLEYAVLLYWFYELFINLFILVCFQLLCYKGSLPLCLDTQTLLSLEVNVGELGLIAGTELNSFTIFN